MSASGYDEAFREMERNAEEGEVVVPKRVTRKYTEEQKLGALEALVRNGFDLDATSDEVGIPGSSIRNWVAAAGMEAPWTKTKRARLRGASTGESDKRSTATTAGEPAGGGASAVPPADLPGKLEFLVDCLITKMPDEWRGREWAIAVGIVVDKLLLVRGMATSRSETLVSRLAEQISPEEREAVIAEAERIIAEADSLPRERGTSDETDR